MVTAPRIRQVVLDCEQPRDVAEFYRALFPELAYRPGDEQPPAGEPDPLGQDWLVLRGPGFGLAFQAVRTNPRPTWPDAQIPQQLHLDTTVPDVDSLAAARARVRELGGVELLDRSDDDEEPLVVFADPAGHPFCIFVDK
ncbi:MAG: VOC family protein [Tetrasphaera sp.]